MDDKKLFLLDAYALIYRAYYALIRSPRMTSAGFNASAVFGFCNTLDEVLRKQNPTHIAVCFDPKGKTFRHEMYDQYKAQREAQPEDIQMSVPIIKEIIAAYNIPMFEVPGYEADDVIGTLARKAAERGFTTYMMTPDKDFGQLVTDRILQYRPSLKGQDFEIRGPQEVCERYGIGSTTQVIDLLALEGDAIDNIPGCPGVGPKTATKLIAEYGSVENMLAHADAIKGALGQKIRDNAQNIRFSKDLATIRTDVPVEVDFDTLRRRPENVTELAALYRRLEFKTFLQRLKVKESDSADEPAPDKKGTARKGNSATADATTQPSLFDFIDSPAPEGNTAAPAALDPETTDYAVADTPAEIGALVAEAAAAKTVGIAIYAPGEMAMTAQFRGLAISPAEGKARLDGCPAAAALLIGRHPDFKHRHKARHGDTASRENRDSGTIFRCLAGPLHPAARNAPPSVGRGRDGAQLPHVGLRRPRRTQAVCSPPPRRGTDTAVRTGRPLAATRRAAAQPARAE